MPSSIAHAPHNAGFGLVRGNLVRVVAAGIACFEMGGE